jgi:hypothetical protein
MNTMGKCNMSGCILPITCSHAGTCSLDSNNRKKRRRIFKGSRRKVKILFMII